MSTECAKCKASGLPWYFPNDADLLWCMWMIWKAVPPATQEKEMKKLPPFKIELERLKGEPLGDRHKYEMRQQYRLERKIKVMETLGRLCELESKKQNPDDSSVLDEEAKIFAGSERYKLHQQGTREVDGFLFPMTEILADLAKVEAKKEERYTVELHMNRETFDQNVKEGWKPSGFWDGEENSPRRLVALCSSCCVKLPTIGVYANLDLTPHRKAPKEFQLFSTKALYDPKAFDFYLRVYRGDDVDLTGVYVA